MSWPWTIVRPPTVYGEWDREVLKVFKLARAGVVPVFGDGTQELSVLYAGDLADALIAAAAAPDAANGLYYAAHPAVTTSRELVRAIGRAVGGGKRREPRIVSLPGPLARALLWTIGSLADLATLLYVTLATGAVLAFWGADHDGWDWLLTAHALLVVLVLLAPVARESGPVGRFLGEWYPILLLLGLYAEVGVVNVDLAYQHDQAIQRLELWVV